MKKKFKLFNTTWNIEVVDAIDSGDENVVQYGKTDGLTHTIYIAKTVGGIEQTEEEKALTLLHEIFHAVLQVGAYSSYCQSEPLVEWLANCVYALKKQGIL